MTDKGDEKVVFLAFENPEAPVSEMSCAACRHCRNKTFKLLYAGESDFPQCICTCCGAYLGDMGWASE